MIKKIFNEDPFWFVVGLFILLMFGSCSTRAIYCDWNDCKKQETTNDQKEKTSRSII